MSFAMKGPTPDSWVRSCPWFRSSSASTSHKNALRERILWSMSEDRMASEFGRLGVSSLRSYSEAADRFGFGSVDAKSRQQSR